MAIGYPDFDGSATMSPADPITSRPSPRQAEWAQARLAAISVRLARAGHDLRGILAPALLTAERLQMHDDPAIKRAGDRVARSVDRATDLVRELVELVRDLPVTLDPPAMELHTAVAQAAAVLRDTNPALAIESTVAKDIVIAATRSGMNDVFVHLLRNAAQAGARIVRVSATTEDHLVLIDLADDGPGLPPAVKETLFRPTDPGLGLAIVRDLVRAQGGDVQLLTTSPIGTSFRITMKRVVA